MHPDSSNISSSAAEQTEQPKGREIPHVPLAEHINHTPFPTQYFQAVDSDGNISHIVVLRITFDMTQVDRDGTLYYANTQTPLVVEDAWYGEPNTSSPLWESDFAPYKPKCDVILANASAYAPKDKAAKRWQVGIGIGEGNDVWMKSIAVTGPRQFGFFGLSEPAAVTSVALRYENAFGGQRIWPEPANPPGPEKLTDKKPDIWDTDERNPVGCGYAQSDFLTRHPKDTRAPQLEMPCKPFTGQRGYAPVGMGAIGRAWLPRRLLAGTYNDEWIKHQWPLPPKNFKYGYWNCAPLDQQIKYPEPGSRISLAHIYPGQEFFTCRLPRHILFLLCVLDSGVEVPCPLKLDTLAIDMKTRHIVSVFRANVSSIENIRCIEARMEEVFQTTNGNKR